MRFGTNLYFKLNWELNATLIYLYINIEKSKKIIQDTLLNSWRNFHTFGNDDKIFF